jgi:hypothetical protein
VGSNRWSSNARPGRFGRKGPERKRERKLSFRSLKRSNALKGEAHERRKLKKAFTDRGRLKTTERVAKPCEWHL